MLARQRPDLLQTFLFHANFVGRIAARRAGVPRVICGVRVAERSSRWHLWLDRLTSRWVDRYACVSQSVARFCVEQAGLAADRLVVIPNGIDVQKFPATNPVDPIMLGIPAGHRLVSFVGRLESQKGVRWLIESAPHWLSQVPDCELVMVGRGPEQAPTERLCFQSGIGQRVHWLGWRGDVPQILAASHLLVLPSRWEGMPNVVLQAMASGLPVVASDVEGVRELLGDDAPQQVVPYGDTPALVERLCRLLLQPDLAAGIGRRNRSRACRDFRIEGVVAAYQQLWTSLLSRSG